MESRWGLVGGVGREPQSSMGAAAAEPGKKSTARHQQDSAHHVWMRRITCADNLELICSTLYMHMYKLVVKSC